MVRRPEEPSKKERTHARIVAEAAKLLRRAGYDGLSVAEVMKEAGLTHGGFYAHFASREALVEEALREATSSSVATFGVMASTPTAASPAGLPALAERYLSDAHTKRPEAGCCLAALASETGRQPRSLKKVARENVASFAQAVSELLPPGTDHAARRDEALVAVAALVGALVLARAVDDPALSRDLRAATAAFVASKAV